MLTRASSSLNGVEDGSRKEALCFCEFFPIAGAEGADRHAAHGL
jgi:hypothetical protein